MTNSEASMRGRLGAHTKWANTTDRTAATAAARRGLDQKFLDEAGGDPKRAESLRKAYFTRMALASVKARRHRADKEASQAERLATHIKKVVDAAPPLTNEQRDKLAILLRRSETCDSS